MLMVKMNFLQWSDTWRSLWTGLGGASSKMSLLGNYCYHLPQTSGSKCLLFLGEKRAKNPNSLKLLESLRTMYKPHVDKPWTWVQHFPCPRKSRSSGESHVSPTRPHAPRARALTSSPLSLLQGQLHNLQAQYKMKM